MAMEHVIINIQKDESEACTLLSIALGTGSDSVVGQEPSSNNPTPMKTPSSTTAASIFRMVKPAYIFLLLSFVAVALDPLFLYIPIIDKCNKCLGEDKTVRNAALILRSLSDIPFLIRIVIKIRSPDKNKNTATVPNSELHVQSDSLWTAIKKYFMSYPRLAKFAKGLALRMPWLSFHFIVEFLAILPVPQVAIAVLFYERTIINLVLFFQYLPRIFLIYLHASSIKKIWIKGVLNFYLYILASHVPMLQYMDPKVLEMMCGYLKPVTYPENSYIVQEGEQLHF
ncbi:cyclic nucleotide-gated ion channel 1-like [Prunus yedoensis var. nudiflora]|uniref:Cyclic nucleotide-gated ion channel 1-like n=1 Tax=Prunus yedoensis var. nudiflora TaxID=2094558 RepID=A0A314U6T1_PRUYE|nr:cyclic nucleotide-gated ion channel 1-like [Prunus yedoensis var. nudiflora]